VSRVDKILETIDAGLGSSREDAGRIIQDRCVHCQWRAAKEGSSWCGPCHPIAPEPEPEAVPPKIVVAARGEPGVVWNGTYMSAATYTAAYTYSPFPETWGERDEEVAW
jgi:hypothetical protein